MEIKKTLYVKNRKEWRRWLEKNYSAENEIWLIFYKKHTKVLCVKYVEAVEEALCFGWIDSLVKSIDEEKYMQKFSQRKKNSKCSELNKARVAALLKEGKMTEAGLEKFKDISNSNSKNQNIKEKKQINMPPDIAQALKQNPVAWKNFNTLAESYKRNYILWITSAKREETVQKRIKEAILLLEQNQKLGLK